MCNAPRVVESLCLLSCAAGMGLVCSDVVLMLWMNESLELYGQPSSSVLATQLPHLHDRVNVLKVDTS